MQKLSIITRCTRYSAEMIHFKQLHLEVIRYTKSFFYVLIFRASSPYKSKIFDVEQQSPTPPSILAASPPAAIVLDSRVQRPQKEFILTKRPRVARCRRRNPELGGAHFQDIRPLGAFDSVRRMIDEDMLLQRPHADGCIREFCEIRIRATTTTTTLTLKHPFSFPFHIFGIRLSKMHYDR